jgi:CRISPR-associated protein Cmr2
VLGDGDGMGKYVSGAKLGTYEKYIVNEKVASEIRDNENYQKLLTQTRKRMGPATHVALNRALLDFSNRLVPYITERRFCGKVVFSGGDDVMVVLPLTDLPEFLLSLRAAWSGTEDPGNEFTTHRTETESAEASGYWHPRQNLPGIPNRPLFTMGKDATMSLGIVIAYKSVPLPTVLETLWTAEKERAKKMPGAKGRDDVNPIPVKDGLCFRVIYGSGNVLEALMKGHLLQAWWDFIKEVRMPIAEKLDLSPLLYRLAEELPKHTAITEQDELIAKAARVIIARREQNSPNS